MNLDVFHLEITLWKFGSGQERDDGIRHSMTEDFRRHNAATCSHCLEKIHPCAVIHQFWRDIPHFTFIAPTICYDLFLRKGEREYLVRKYGPPDVYPQSSHEDQKLWKKAKRAVLRSMRERTIKLQRLNDTRTRSQRHLDERARHNRIKREKWTRKLVTTGTMCSLAQNWMFLGLLAQTEWVEYENRGIQYHLEHRGPQ